MIAKGHASNTPLEPADYPYLRTRVVRIEHLEYDASLPVLWPAARAARVNGEVEQYLFILLPNLASLLRKGHDALRGADFEWLKAIHIKPGIARHPFRYP